MRKISLVLITIGAFLIVTGPMIKYYVYPRLAVAPVDQDTTTYLDGANATVFDVSSLKPITTDLKIVAHTVGDPAVSESCPGAVTYVTAMSTLTSSGSVVSQQIDRTTMNARSAMPEPSCEGDFISTVQGVEDPVTRQGLTQKFPFNAGQQDYLYWDSQVGTAHPIKYVRETTYEGVAVYEFRQVIPAQKIGTLDVPASMAGQRGDAMVTADKVYSNDRTLWVEPETGLIVDRLETPNLYLEYQDRRGVTLNESTLSYAAETVEVNLERAANAGALHAMRVTAPLVAVPLGLALLVTGVIINQRRRPLGADIEAPGLGLVGAQ